MTEREAAIVASAEVQLGGSFVRCRAAVRRGEGERHDLPRRRTFDRRPRSGRRSRGGRPRRGSACLSATSLHRASIDVAGRQVLLDGPAGRNVCDQALNSARARGRAWSTRWHARGSLRIGHHVRSDESSASLVDCQCRTQDAMEPAKPATRRIGARPGRCSWQ